MRSDTLLFLDTETGGINPLEHSLLSIGLAVWNDSRVIVSKEILIREENIRVTEEAMKINQINLPEHVSQALNSQDAMATLIDFLERNFERGMKITLVGHNIAFDVSFLKEFFSKNGVKYSDYFSHRTIDTASILYFLYLSGKIPNRIVSSDEAFQVFRIPVSKRHSALGDCLATAELFRKLLQVEQVSANKI